MKTQLFSSILLSLALMFLVGCAQAAQSGEIAPLAPSPTSLEQLVKTEPGQPTETPMIEPAPADSGGPVQLMMPASRDVVDDELVSRAKADLAGRLGIPPDQVTLISVVNMEFTAQAFFCQTVKERITRDVPAEIISGQIILLAAGGEKYEYHVDENNLILCRRPQNQLRS
jgi:hypothetical protein